MRLCLTASHVYSWMPTNLQHSRSTACALLSSHDGYLLIQAIFQALQSYSWGFESLSKRYNRTLGICSDPIYFGLLGKLSQKTELAIRITRRRLRMVDDFALRLVG